VAVQEALRLITHPIAKEDLLIERLNAFRHTSMCRLRAIAIIAETIGESSDDSPIVHAMIAMARSLHIECVAEGVETLDQQIFLRNRCVIRRRASVLPPGGA